MSPLTSSVNDTCSCSKFSCHEQW